ncbi:hypothetical protein B5F10_02140 [Anaerotruncus colihominis]|uniref:Uncharacterized protein n=1 Tax=Anaerotruncus colihominis TaxID=169435 RepID=A0A1Y4MPR5_9FIRM|nr:hypothetical protein [Anaerotruncus colihominis]OUP70707.1 hypothetical protein B5F11_04480 [Anaerotruncus colihominis]OUP75957.1 hypothetical protein B5F10_02140 [Anaerotruncus colihominis]
MNWDDMRRKYPDRPYREEMTKEREKEFVNDCFSCYEGEGFAKKFWSIGDDYKGQNGKPFKVIGRVPIFDKQHPNGADLECLPMWFIQFEDGLEMAAYPDEIVPREMRDNGCPNSFFE